MMDAQLADYRRLGLESSNLLMEWDGLWVLGRYEEATLAVFKAGHVRHRMGRLCLEGGDVVWAITDWLSATDCFLQAASPQYARELLIQLQVVQADGGFPANRPDLIEILGERVDGVRQLEDKVRTFSRTFDERGYREDVPDPRALEFLTGWVRDLPGFAPLHYVIFRQCDRLGDVEAAERHLYWATQFDPNEASYVSTMSRKLIEAGRFDEAWGVGETFLSSNPPDSGEVRLMLVEALLARADGPAYRRAIEILEPLVSFREVGDDGIRMRAIDLTEQFRQKLARNEQTVHLSQFDG